MSNELIAAAEQHEYRKLFITDLNWSAPDQPPVEVDLDNGQKLTATNVSSYKGLRVWVCDQRPGSQAEAALDRLLAKTSTDRLVIFYDDHDQVWRWPVRRRNGSTTTTRLTSHRHRTGTPNPKFADRLAAIQLPMDQMLDPNTVLARVRAAFDVEARNETKHASKLMSRMYSALEKAYATNYPARQRDHEISVTLARILFLMFGDDTDMWTADLFRDLIHQHTAQDGSDIGQAINNLFIHLDTVPGTGPEPAPHLQDFPYVNGGIFSQRIALPAVNAEFRDAVLDACAVDWSTISPAIFGSMFQSVRDAKTRREMGEHYTSEENILKTLRPLFLDELHEEFDRARTMKNEALILNRLWDRLGRIRFMDPACGCGNFIIVAYRELRDLELQIMERLQDLASKESGEHQLGFEPTLALKVTLDHFYGIELDEWPARIAETAMFLVDRQCDIKLKERFGEAPQRLPIQQQATIVAGRSALTLGWADIVIPTDDVIIAGNPPFLGHASRSDEQARELRTVWGKDDISRLDYVTGWYAQALRYFGSHNGLWAFVSTNSITQGDPVPHLFGPIFDGGWRIKFAHRTFPWTSEAVDKAAVHCVIIGFTRDEQIKPRLFDYPRDGRMTERVARSINAYLVDGPEVFVLKQMNPLSPNLPPATFGNMPRDDGNLVVTPDEYDEVWSDAIARKYLRPFLGAEELLHGKERWCLWLVDLDKRDLARSRILADRVEAVRRFRLKSTASSTRQMANTPHLFGQRPALHSKPYLIIPSVCSERRDYFPVRRVDPTVIASNATFTAADPSGLLFAVISSSMFVTWQRTVGGRLKSDLRFSNTIVWNNLPLPPVSAALRIDAIQAGKAVEAARDAHPGATLAQLYEPTAMPPDLLEAHRALDGVVDRLFSLTTTEPTELQRQDVLFSRYQELTAPLLATASKRKGQ